MLFLHLQCLKFWVSTHFYPLIKHIQSVFAVLDVKEMSLPIVEQAIQLRQIRKMSPGDALIAATALHFNADIYTRNVTDFNWITGLSVVNPI
jgi:toxin FitB